MTRAPAPEAVDEAAALLAELIDVPSPSGAEGRIAERVEQLCAEWELDCRRVGSETGRDSLVVGPPDPALAIAAHLDTVDAPWPARARVEGTIVHGLGAVDDKGGVVACLLAARELRRGGDDLARLGVAFALPVDEERGGSGSRALALELRPRYAIALEATELNTGTAEIGDIEGIVHVGGESAHGARADLGVNAIDRAVAMINALPSLELARHSHALLGASSAEVSTIGAGTEFNTIPDRCSFKLGIRLVPGQSVERTLAALERLALDHVAYVELIEVTAPIETPAASRVVEGLDAACRQVVGRGSEPIGVPAWTDAHNFHAFAGAEVVVFGPGGFDTAHTPEEHIDARQVVECAGVFTELARRGWREPA